MIWPPIRRAIGGRKILRQYGEHLLRTVIVLCTFLLAALVPCLEQMISLVGSLSISSLALVFPPIIEIVGNIPGSKSLAPIGLNEYKRKHHIEDVAASNITGSYPRMELGHMMNGKQDEKSLRMIHEHQLEQLRRQGFQDENDAGSCQFKWIVIRGIFIMIMGILASVVGTYCAIHDIVEALKNSECNI